MIEEAIREARKKGLPQENYWVYYKKDWSRVKVSAEEKKTVGYIGFFVEDDSRIQVINEIAMKKIRKK